MIYNDVEKLMAWIGNQFQHDALAKMRANFLALTTNVVNDYCLQIPLKLLDQGKEQEAIDWHQTISSLTDMAPVARQWSWITPLALRMPYSLIKLCSFKVGRIVKFHKVGPRGPGRCQLDRLTPAL